MKYKKIGEYDIYKDGRLYSHKSRRFLKGDWVGGYLQYTLSIDGVRFRKKAHRLVAENFLPPHEEGKDIVNHIDGDKTNNHYTNLEWTDYYGNNKHARDLGLNNVSESNSRRWLDEGWAQETRNNIKKGKIGKQKGEDNPNFKYRILDAKGRRYSREEFREYLQCSQSWADILIRRLCFHSEKVTDKRLIGFSVIHAKKVNRLSERSSE